VEFKAIPDEDGESGREDTDTQTEEQRSSKGKNI